MKISKLNKYDYHDYYDDYIEQACKKYEIVDKRANITYPLPKNLLKALIKAESNFNSKAYRYEKHLNDASYGLCQILFKTAQWIGYKGKPSGLFNPKINIDLGAKYLVSRINIWQKETGINMIQFGLGSYNAGLGTILKAQQKAYKMNLDTTLWTSIEKTLPEVSNFSQITISYVRKIIKMWEKYEGGDLNEYLQLFSTRHKPLEVFDIKSGDKRETERKERTTEEENISNNIIKQLKQINSETMSILTTISKIQEQTEKILNLLTDNTFYLIKKED